MAAVFDHPEAEIAHRLAALDWPTPPAIHAADADAETRKALYQAQVNAFAAWLQALVQAELDAQKATAAAATADQQAIAASERARADAQTADDRARRAAEYTNYYTVFQAVQSAYLGAARDAITSAQARAQFVVSAAGAIGSLYTGLLGLVYGLSSPGHTLPERAVWAGVFLGLALVLATFYWSYLTKRPSGEMTQPSAGLRIDAIQRVYAFVTWAQGIVLTRRYALQCAVISLGIGVAFLPVAFTTLSNTSARWLALVGLVLVFGIPALPKARAYVPWLRARVWQRLIHR